VLNTDLISDLTIDFRTMEPEVLKC